MTHGDFAAAFRPGTRFVPRAQGQAFAVVVHEAGRLRCPSGSITCCDPLVAWQVRPFARKVKPGSYPVSLSVADFGGDQRVAAARVKFAASVATRWVMAATNEAHLAKLKPGEIVGYGVDAGTGCFTDGKAARRLAAEPFQDQLGKALEETYRSTWSWANVPLGDDASVVAFSSGYGDGFYASWWGFDRKGALVALVTDFGLLMEPVERVTTIAHVATLPVGPVKVPEMEDLGVRISVRALAAGARGPTVRIASRREVDLEVVDARGKRLGVPMHVDMTSAASTYSFPKKLPREAGLRLTALVEFAPVRHERPRKRAARTRRSTAR